MKDVISEDLSEKEPDNTIKPKGTRLHKSSPLFILIHVVIKSIIPLAVGVFTYGASKYSNTLVISSAVFITFFALLQYWFYHYWIKEDKIEIKEGIFFKNNRKVPYSRIQNVNVVQNILQRLFNVATLQLESASGGKPEAVMRVVDLATVEIIKKKVKEISLEVKETEGINNQESKGEVKSESRKSTPLHSLTTLEVIKYGIISQKGMLYGAVLFGFVAQYEAFIFKTLKSIGFIFDVPDFTKLTLTQGAFYVAIIGLVLFVFLQLMSILWALMKFYGFSIEKHEDRLQAHMGLLSKVSATIPLKKIQLYRFSENPLHKYFKAQTVTIETAGGVNTDNSGIVMRWLAPFIKVEKVKSFVEKIEPKIAIDPDKWVLIPHRAWLRVLKRSLFLLALLSAVLIGIASVPQITLRLHAWIFIVLMVPVIFLYSKNYVKKTAYYINNDIICFKSGVWFSKQSFVKISKIQSVEIHESPFDRKNKMATLSVDTAGSNPLLHYVRIPYLELADAYELQEFIQKRLDETEFDW